MNNPTSVDTAQTTTTTTSASSSAASTTTHHHQLLNLPSTMSRSNLTFQTLTPNPNPNSNRIDRMLNSNSNSRSPSQTIYSDRFIPSRSGSNFALFDISPTKKTDDGVPSMYTTLLKTALFGVVVPPMTPDKRASVHRNIFRYKSETKQSMHSLSPFGFDDDAYSGVVQSPIRTHRKVAKSPFKVLDAPALQDDFYLNLVDWSPLNVLAVGLGNCVYLWNASTSKVTKLCELGDEARDDSVCSVSWAQRGTHLAVGTSNGKLQLWDASRCKRVRTMEGHKLRVGALAWSSTLLSSCSRDKTILHRDIRAQEDYVSKLTGHKAEVCGLKWSYDNRELASGGNDNKLFVWNQHSTHPVLKYTEHTAAVKAITWSPHAPGLLASGGGTADRCIRFWNTTTNSHLSCVDTGSQVCNLAWSKNVNEIVSTHGYSQNQIIVWRYPTVSKVVTLTGHSFRVLYLAVSPDGQTIVTGAGDETLRFWNVFPSLKSQNPDRELGASSRGRTVIR